MAVKSDESQITCSKSCYIDTGWCTFIRKMYPFWSKKGIWHMNVVGLLLVSESAAITTPWRQQKTQQIGENTVTNLGLSSLSLPFSSWYVCYLPVVPFVCHLFVLCLLRCRGKAFFRYTTHMTPFEPPETQRVGTEFLQDFQPIGGFLGLTLTHIIHGTGIFTYIFSWILKCLMANLGK